MKPLRTAFLDFWNGFEPAEFSRRFPDLARVRPLEVVEDPRSAELVIFSCYPGGRRTTRPRDPRASSRSPGVRLFYTAENIRPDFALCDFAMSFARDLVDERHVRAPNYLGTQLNYGFAPDALLHPPADPGAVRSAKTRFCTYVQRNRVPYRERFVQKLAKIGPVDCAGPSLNNTGFIASRRRKYELYRESKFAVTFENEASVGYTSEKLPDALLTDCVPLYRGDPTVHLDFSPGCFLDLAHFEHEDAMLERIAELQRDDAAYEALLAAPRYPGGTYPSGLGPGDLRPFFERVVAAVRPAPLLSA